MASPSVIEHHADQLRRFGVRRPSLTVNPSPPLTSLAVQFTVIPDVVPADALAEVRDNVLRADEEIAAASAAETAPSAMLEGFTERATELMAARGFLPERDAHPDPAARRSVERHNSLLDEVSAELGLTDPYEPGVPTARTNAGLNDVVYYPAIAEYLADPRVVGVARAVMDPHVRIAQLEINKTIHGQSSSSGMGHAGPTPAADRRSSGPWFDEGPQDRRHWHSGKVQQPPLRLLAEVSKEAAPRLAARHRARRGRAHRPALPRL